MSTTKKERQVINRIEKLRKRLESYYGDNVSVHYTTSYRTATQDYDHQLWAFDTNSDILIYVIGQPNLSTAIDKLWKQIERNARSN